jgi:methylmalonyl-CoA/ethylmalonyl-CoA epimerase
MAMKIKRIAHIGIACKDSDEVKKLYVDNLSLEVTREEMQGEVKISFVPVGETNVELTQSTTEEGIIAKFVDKRGEGIHHIAFEVEDIDSALEELRAKGLQLVDEKARPGAHDARIAFVHPKGTHGVLIELVEYPSGSH